MFRKHLRFRRRIFVGLAFAALAVPAAAQAQTGVFIDGGPLPVSTVTASTQSPTYLRYHEVGGPVGTQIRSEHSRTVATITPLQADGIRWNAISQFYKQQQEQMSQAISERSNGVKGPDPSLVPQLTLSTSDGFDWKDAGIGASTVFAAALLLGIALVLTRRHQHSGLTSA